MASSTATSRSPSPSSHANPQERACDSSKVQDSYYSNWGLQERACDSSKVQDSNDGQGVTHQSRGTEKNTKHIYKKGIHQFTWTTDDEFPKEDGYSWRKYGQKSLLSSKFTRNYYKCTHQRGGCPAKKQVEKLSDDPPRYRTTYRLEHTCKKPQLYTSANSGSSICIGSGESSLPNDPTLYPLLPYDPSLCSSESTVDFDSSLNYSSVDNNFRDFKFESDDRIIEDKNDYCSILNLVPEDCEFESDDGIREEKKDYCYILNLIPEDYEFEEDTIIQVWLAEEYMTDEDMGQYCFRSLLNGDYVLHSGTNFVTKKKRYRTNVRKLKTLLEGQEDNGNIFLKWENGCQLNDNMTNCAEEVEHVSLVCNDIDATLIFEKLEQFKQLRTLLFLHKYGNKVMRIPDHLFQSFEKLRALDLSRTHIKKLPSSVGCMIGLRYLDLSWTLIEWLPDTICSLVELQTLKLKGCSNLRGLPTQFKRLTRLRHLDVDVLRQLATLPRGIGALLYLRTLSAFLVGREEGCKINELENLNELSGDFCIAMLENVGSGHEAKAAGLCYKSNVKKLELRWTASQLLRTDNNCYDVLKCLRPPQGLAELQIFCYEGSIFPTWVGNPIILNRLVSITFFNCEHALELPLLEGLPCLEHLELVSMNGVKRIERRRSPDYAAFPRLEKLCINGMQCLEAWSWVKANEGDYNSLVELTVNGCPNFQEFTALSCMSSIKHLEIRECLKLKSLSNTKLPDSLEDLVVEDCPRIKKKSLQQGGEEWHKVQHVPNICINTEDDDNDDGDEE